MSSLDLVQNPLEAFALACKATGPITLRARHRASGVEQVHTVNAPFAFLGRSPAVGVRLDDPSVSQCHAYLQVIEGGLHCIDLGSRTGVVWDDGTKGRGWVGPADLLRIGAFEVRVTGPEPLPDSPTGGHGDEPEPPLTPAGVEIHSGGVTATHALERPITMVGRHPACDLRSLDEALGYFQCALVDTPDGVWFVDTLSRKGAVLNGRGTRLARLRNGDLLEVGKVSLVFWVGDRAGQLATVAPVAPADPAGVLATRLAESVAVAFAPVGEMVRQFQQCFTTMAQMFASMQQEHAALVCEQMRQIQELSRELRELRVHIQDRDDSPAPPAAAEQPEGSTTPQPRLPTPRLTDGAEGQALIDAHTWFTERLAKQGEGDSVGS